MTLPRLGFIGIGLMGDPMTRRLLDAGFAVTVWNRTPAKAEPLRGPAPRWPVPLASWWQAWMW